MDGTNQQALEHDYVDPWLSHPSANQFSGVGDRQAAATRLAAGDKWAHIFAERPTARPPQTSPFTPSSEPTGRLLELIGSIYEAALNPAGLPAALTGLASALQAREAQLHLWDHATGQVADSVLCDRSDPAAEAAYVTHYGAIDPWRNALQCQQPGTVLRCHHRFDAAFVAGSAFYQDYFIPAGKRWTTGTYFKAEAEMTAVLSVRREPNRSPYEDWTDQALLRLAPHFQRAALLRRQLGSRRAAGLHAEALVHALPIACALLDKQGRIVVHNAAARSVLAALSGQPQNEPLRLAEVDAQLHRSMSVIQTAHKQLPQTLQIASNLGGAWRMHLIALHTLGSSRDACELGMTLAVFETAMRSEAGRLAAARARYRLTAAQAGVLEFMLKGKSVKQIAVQRACSVDTVRAHVKAVLERTGFHSQRELVAALAHS